MERSPESCKTLLQNEEAEGQTRDDVSSRISSKNSSQQSRHSATHRHVRSQLWLGPSHNFPSHVVIKGWGKKVEDEEREKREVERGWRLS